MMMTYLVQKNNSTVFTLNWMMMNNWKFFERHFLMYYMMNTKKLLELQKMEKFCFLKEESKNDELTTITDIISWSRTAMCLKNW